MRTEKMAPNFLGHPVVIDRAAAAGDKSSSLHAAVTLSCRSVDILRELQ